MAMEPLDPGPLGACGRPFGFSCYRGELSGRVEPGASVALRGELASGGAVRGAAVAPAVPALSVDGAGPGDTVRISLSDAGPAPELLGLDAMPSRVGAADTMVAAIVWTGPRTLTCVVLLPGSPAPRPASTCAGRSAWASPRIAPTAPASLTSRETRWFSAGPSSCTTPNFTAWTELSPQVQENGSIGIEGVSGVFGAATPRSFVLVVTP